MSLLKCPECGNPVSEHADFCVKCGCKIAYILDYYKKQKIEFDNSKKIIADNDESKDVYSRLNKEVKSFIDKINADLTEADVPFYLDKQKNFVGFRKKKYEPLFVYLSIYSNGEVSIYLRDQQLGYNKRHRFESAKVSDYIDYIENVLFDISKYREELDNAVDYYVIKDKSTESYFSGFHKTKQYETIGNEFNTGSSQDFEVPDFVINIRDAYKFYTKDGAEKVLNKLCKAITNLVVEKHNL